ncbi:IclR family transcriptional regulator [Auritidibacter ignavus]|uniref:IclR family transcriptional regulator n=1 Tax=Auritidibacter ignavus TaxID=678932 RepID=UPI002FE61FA1
MIEQKSVLLTSVTRAMVILELVAEHGGLTLTDIARQLEMGKTTILRHVKTLMERDWLICDDQLRYRIGPGVSGLVSDPYSDLRSLMRPLMEELWEKTRETIHLTVLQGRYVVYVEQLISPKPVHSVSTLGSRSPAHCVSPGLAQLALLPREQVNWILSEPRQRHTNQTLLTLEEIWNELEVVKKRGYAINRGAFRSEVGGVGAAITDFSGYPVAALSVCVPTYRLKTTDVEAVGQLLRRTVSGISRSPALPRIFSSWQNKYPAHPGAVATAGSSGVDSIK